MKKRILVISSQYVNKHSQDFCISQREIFTNSTAFTVINKYGKDGAVPLQQCFVPLTCRLSKGPMKRDFLEIWLTTFFGVRNFGNKSAMKVIFFWKCSIVNLHFKSAVSNWENVLSFWANSIWIVCLKMSLLTTEYLPSVVNMLTKILKTLYIPKRHFFKLNILHSDQ